MANHSIKLAIWGLGAAGRARQRAIDEVEGLVLAGIVSRRPEVATRPLQEVLEDLEVRALAISLENTAHEAAVRLALESDKHVLVDYPLSFRSSSGEALFRLARQQNKVLHVEHIGLLTQEHRSLKDQAGSLGSLLKGDYLFQGGWNQKTADAHRTGPYPILALPRLLQLADLFGPFQLEAREIRGNDQEFFLHAHLHFERGGTLGFTEERRPGLPRRRSLVAQGKKDSIHWKAGLGGGGLFRQDLAWFRDRLLGKKTCYYDEGLMLQVIGQLEKLGTGY